MSLSKAPPLLGGRENSKSPQKEITVVKDTLMYRLLHVYPARAWSAGAEEFLEVLPALIPLCFGSWLSWEVPIVAKDSMMEVLIM